MSPERRFTEKYAEPQGPLSADRSRSSIFTRKTAASMEPSMGFFNNILLPRYLSSEDAKEVRAFKFVGEDRSLLYNYVLSPLCEVIIQWVPKWVHPNVLTLCGLLCNVISHLIVFWYCPSLTEPCPAWVWALTGIMVIAYSFFDNLDGKQARRLGLSSPLGLLVDHGCDSINVVVGTFSAAALFQSGAGLRTLLMLFMISTQFFFAVWEEYYRGEFILPYINGPNEGILVLATIYLLSSQMPDYASFWHVEETLPFFGGSFQRCDIGLGLLLTGGILVILTHVYGVYSHLTTPREQRKRMNTRTHDLHDAFSTAAPYCVGVILACLWVTFSPEGVAAQHPRLTIWFIGILFSYAVAMIQVAHVCDGDLAPCRWPCIVPVVMISCNCVLGLLSPDNRPLIHEPLLLVFVSTFALLSWLSMVISVLRDISEALSVPMWTVPPKVQASCRSGKKLTRE
ncbi:phosphotransferase 1 [Perkinsus olseni]|uniref:Phosphotransferase 1 n=1 Tax=Perkinsus olseni TaxID=32597 RepID=A0A7J6PJW3_PEROL|nr:phosphotransferase 1 [Perkinsus olseni]